jgi:hypothetical protein
MGQHITVTSRAGVRPEVMHFELNRSLTGMQTDRYASVEDATGTKPPDELARRLFALGVAGVTVYSSSVTVTAPAERWGELQPKVEDTITNLFIHYRDGTVLPAISAGAEPAAAESAAAKSAATESAPTESVPAESAAPAE